MNLRLLARRARPTRLALAAVFALAATLAVSAASAGTTAGPVILSVTFNGSVASPEFVLAGREFGTLPPVSQPPGSSPNCHAESQTGDVGANYGNKLYFRDNTNELSAGLSGPFGNSPNIIDCVGLIVSTFTPTRVVYTPGSIYRSGNYAVNEGDSVSFVVNGASALIRVRYGATVRNTDVCVVPRILGLTLAKAKAKLRGTGCLLGKVTRPKKPPKRPLVVKKQSPAANAAVPAGTSVRVRLG